MKKKHIYRQVYHQIPYTPEADVEAARCMYKWWLKMVNGRMSLIKKDKPVFINQPYIQQRCHACSIIFYLQNPGSKLYTGFAIIEEKNWNCSIWYHHTFCVYNNQIIENTPITRSEYYGVELKGKRLKKFLIKMLHVLKAYTDAYGPLDDQCLQRLADITKLPE